MSGRSELSVRGTQGHVAAELENERGLVFRVLDNGAVHDIRHGRILINQVLGSPVEGGLGNLYLRTHGGGSISWVPLLGPAGGSLRAGSSAARWDGTHEGLQYTCTLRLAARRDIWYWTIRIVNQSSRTRSLDAVYAQDLGIAEEAAVRSSEPYTSQYIDHTVLQDDDLGYLLCSRQNLPQGGTHPWLVLGCLHGAAGFLTDGFQFYGLDYKATNAPAALARRTLPNCRYQYEFALPTLQSRRLRVRPGDATEITFFGAYVGDHPRPSGPGDAEEARAAAATFRQLPTQAGEMLPVRRAAGAFDAPTLFASRDLTPAELERHFGAEWRHVEQRDGRLLSFFHGRQAHVVLRAKELLVERPTGHILRSGRDMLPSDDILSVTAWMFGVFASQLAIGNTSFDKLLTVCRNPLNVLKASGQRIFVKTDQGSELLGVPSAFEVDANSARWVYQDDQRVIVIRTWTSLDDPAWFLDVAVETGGPLEFLITHEIVLGTNEYDSDGRVLIDEASGRVELTPAADTLMAREYPEATFFLVSCDADKIDRIGGDELLYADGADRGHGCVVLRTKPVSRFSLAVTGSAVSARRARQLADRCERENYPYEAAQRDAAALWAGVARGAVLGGTAGRRADDVARLNDVLPWYLHNAMIHYLTPHGLEQYSGAAWGLRDVCQGPVELLIGTRHHAEVREVLKLVYAHQYRQTGDWPQWFMFDRYRSIQAPESHADIVHWPLKAVCDYLEATGDFAILRDEVAYTDERTMTVTTDTESLLAHIEKQIDRIEAGCIPGTALVAYGHGDWEDTLQPADATRAGRLVSSWTVELAYQTLGRFRVVCERAGEGALAQRLSGWCERIRFDFNRYLVKDGVVAGLAYFGEGDIEYFLHPRDRKTGVSYRLLPMTRGMISGLFTPDQARRHLALIERHLTFPDGVRLMDRPMEYHGGTERHFKRAETAANFGREIGLQYVHAHLRYVEAMTKIGRPEEAFAGILAVSPIALERSVPSALPRQSNCYFSSSDADFADRYEASRHFRRLRTGAVGVKGGWRVYSSGPGIYVNLLISNILGLRDYFDDVLLDPVLPSGLDGLTFDFEYEGRRVRYLFRVARDGFSPDMVRINGRAMPTDRRAENPYRPGGLLISKERFRDALSRDDNLVEIRI